jgi:ankyrin repeat protein
MVLFVWLLIYIAKNDQNYTALGIAAYQGNTNIATMLIEAGADVNYQDSQVTSSIYCFWCSDPSTPALL